jgi:hypothetical protein
MIGRSTVSVMIGTNPRRTAWPPLSRLRSPERVIFMFFHSAQFAVHILISDLLASQLEVCQGTSIPDRTSATAQNRGTGRFDELESFLACVRQRSQWSLQRMMGSP